MTRGVVVAAVCAFPVLIHAALGPRYGGELRIGAIAYAPSLEPAPAADPARRLLLGMVHDTLVRASADGPRASLAESWVPNADGREWTLALAPRLRFHDGAEINGEAVARSLRRFLRSDSAAAAVLASALDHGLAFRSGSSADLPALEVTDAQHVRLKFRAPVSALSLLPLASPAAAITSERGAACGPFVPTVTTGDELLFVAFGDHVGGRPYLDRIRVRLVPDARRLAADRRLGRVDIALGAAGRRHAPGVLVLALDPTKPPFDAKPLRLALAAALDREAIAGRILEGAEPWDRLLPLDGATASDAPRTRTATPREALHSSSSRITLVVDRTLPPLASQRIVAHLADIGLTTQVRALDPDAVRQTAAEARLFIFEPEVDEPVLAIHELASLQEPSDAPLAALEGDASARLAMALEIEERLRAGGALIPLARLSRASDVADEVQGARADRYTLRVEDAWMVP
jgi:ABC-type transport system substrate-binding protein